MPLCYLALAETCGALTFTLRHGLQMETMEEVGDDQIDRKNKDKSSGKRFVIKKWNAVAMCATGGLARMMASTWHIMYC